MQIGVMFEPSPNAYYRAIYPVEAMRLRGHDVAWPPPDGLPTVEWLTGCDVVHVYRRGNLDTQRVVSELARLGTPITYDNDDDFTTIPEESPSHKVFGGEIGQWVFMETVNMARAAQVFTTTSQVLADRYRLQDVSRVEVIPNHLPPDPRPQHRPGDGVVVGWMAASDHRADAARIPIADALRELVDKYPEVRVECIGVDLGLPERYRHDSAVGFEELPSRIAGFDIGIAPLADITFNHCRSDIKLKEYAAAGIPWLASPVGPYAGLGEQEGGRLVADDGWFAALEALVLDPEARARLGRVGLAWSSSNTIEVVANRWERVFLEAASKPRDPVPASATNLTISEAVLARFASPALGD